MGTMSAAEAKLDAAIRPEITVLRSRTSYPVRHRPADSSRTAGADGGGAGDPLHVIFASGAFAARAAEQATATGRRKASAAPAGSPAADSEPSAHRAARRMLSAQVSERLPVASSSVAGKPAPGAVRVRAAGLRSARKQAPIRLTRRGRVVVTVLVVIAALAACGVLWLIVAGQAQASNHTRPGVPAGQGMVRVMVRPGQTLWSIALRAEPSADPRAVVQEIIDANSLSGPAIEAGAVLWVPRG